MKTRERKVSFISALRKFNDAGWAYRFDCGFVGGGDESGGNFCVDQE